HGRLPLDAAAHGPQETRQSAAQPAASRHSPRVSGAASTDSRPDAAHLVAISAGQSNARVHRTPGPRALSGTVAASSLLEPVAPREIAAHLRPGYREYRAQRPLPDRRV